MTSKKRNPLKIHFLSIVYSLFFFHQPPNENFLFTIACAGVMSRQCKQLSGLEDEQESRQLALTVLDITGVIYVCGSSGINTSFLHSLLLLRLPGKWKELEKWWQEDPLTHLIASSPPPSSPRASHRSPELLWHSPNFLTVPSLGMCLCSLYKMVGSLPRFLGNTTAR